ncbi:hypothetical protein AVEN_247414-1 [Araneus ventricosus]|uniref:Uncharacterized protein n=1 Tax=Araneus ventricosus TaxID=182803 RepID=A0A4Y2U531_ARAVE|nr:hypothetical protein AVEN_247414-1 [Araneus ventricosus]
MKLDHSVCDVTAWKTIWRALGRRRDRLGEEKLLSSVPQCELVGLIPKIYIAEDLVTRAFRDQPEIDAEKRILAHLALKKADNGLQLPPILLCVM